MRRPFGERATYPRYGSFWISRELSKERVVRKNLSAERGLEHKFPCSGIRKRQEDPAKISIKSDES